MSIPCPVSGCANRARRYGILGACVSAEALAIERPRHQAATHSSSARPPRWPPLFCLPPIPVQRDVTTAPSDHSSRMLPSRQGSGSLTRWSRTIRCCRSSCRT